MALEGIESSSGELLATEYDGYAISEPIVQSNAIDLTDNLVAHYLLNNNSDDCHGAFDSTDTAMTYNGQVGEFNGVNGYIELPNFGWSQTQDWTVSFWIKNIDVSVARIRVYEYDSGTFIHEEYFQSDQSVFHVRMIWPYKDRPSYNNDSRYNDVDRLIQYHRGVS